MAEMIDLEVSGLSGNLIFRKGVLSRRLIENFVEDVLDFAHDSAGRTVPKRTGNLSRNIDESGVTRIGNLYQGRVGINQTAPYGEWVERGTGIHGPFKTPIVPVRATYLKWTTARIRTRSIQPGPRRGTLLAKPVRFKTTHYARSVKGQRPRRFMRQAYVATRTFYVPARLRVLETELRLILTKT